MQYSAPGPIVCVTAKQNSKDKIIVYIGPLQVPKQQFYNLQNIKNAIGRSIKQKWILLLSHMFVNLLVKPLHAIQAQLNWNRQRTSDALLDVKKEVGKGERKKRGKERKDKERKRERKRRERKRERGSTYAWLLHLLQSELKQVRQLV